MKKYKNEGKLEEHKKRGAAFQQMYGSYAAAGTRPEEFLYKPVGLYGCVIAMFNNITKTLIHQQGDLGNWKKAEWFDNQALAGLFNKEEAAPPIDSTTAAPTTPTSGQGGEEREEEAQVAREIEEAHVAREVNKHTNAPR